jgi:hypothetical protein
MKKMNNWTNEANDWSTGDRNWTGNPDPTFD